MLATRPASVVAADAEVKTAHLLVRGDVAEAELARYGALAEACWEHWKAYFGAEPKKKDLPLLLDVRRDREGFEGALRRAGVDAQAWRARAATTTPAARRRTCSSSPTIPRPASSSCTS